MTRGRNATPTHRAPELTLALLLPSWRAPQIQGQREIRVHAADLDDEGSGRVTHGLEAGKAARFRLQCVDWQGLKAASARV